MQGQKYTVACCACLNVFACPEAGLTVSRSTTKGLSNLSGPWWSHNAISWDDVPFGKERCAADVLITFARPQAQSTAGRSATRGFSSRGGPSEYRCNEGGLRGQKHVVACRTSLNAFVCLQARRTIHRTRHRATRMGNSPPSASFRCYTESFQHFPSP